MRQALAEAVAKENKLIEFVVEHQKTHNMTPYLRQGDQFREQVDRLKAQLDELNAPGTPSPHRRWWPRTWSPGWTTCTTC